jgi:hypothetical protein
VEASKLSGQESKAQKKKRFFRSSLFRTTVAEKY